MRRHDSGWRDANLTAWHGEHGHDAPAAGMHLPMIEYDHGKPVGVISYLRRVDSYPGGTSVVAAYEAFGALFSLDDVQLPFLTAAYDPRSWSFQLFPHNGAAVRLIGGTGWRPVTEYQFAQYLYDMRGRYMPDLKPYGIDFSRAPWMNGGHGNPEVTPEAWPGELMSQRRRNYEPVSSVRMSWRNPCLDVDLAVVDGDSRLALVVDYKAPAANFTEGSTNMQALSRLRTQYSGGGLSAVPAMVAQYKAGEPGWSFRVRCLNATARDLLAYALGADSSSSTDTLARAIAGEEWIDLGEQAWVNVLNCARDL